MIDFNLPSLNQISNSSSKELQQIKEYLFMLTKELRYMLNNIGEENLNTDLSSTITDTSKAVSTVESNIQDVSGAIAKVEKASSNLSLNATNHTRSCTLTLKLSDTVLSTVTVQFTGNFVTDTQLETELNNYPTNAQLETKLKDYVTDTQLDTELRNYEATKLSGATGTFSSLSSSSGNVQIGETDIKAANLYAMEADTIPEGAMENYYYPLYITRDGEIVKGAEAYSPAEGGLNE